MDYILYFNDNNRCTTYQARDIRLVASINSPQKHISPPITRAFCASVPVKWNEKGYTCAIFFQKQQSFNGWYCRIKITAFSSSIGHNHYWMFSERCITANVSCIHLVSFWVKTPSQFSHIIHHKSLLLITSKYFTSLEKTLHLYLKRSAEKIRS